MDKSKKTLIIYIAGVIALAFLVGGIAGYFGSSEFGVNPIVFISIMLPLGVAVAISLREESEESEEDSEEDGDKDEKDGNKDDEEEEP